MTTRLAVLAVGLCLWIATPASAVTTSGEQTIALVYIAWTGETPQYPDGAAAGVKALNAINNTWQVGSFGKMWVTGRGWGPYFVPKRTVNTFTLLQQLTAEVRTQALARGDAWASDLVTPVGWIVPQIQQNSEQFGSNFYAINGSKIDHEYGHLLGFPHSRAESYVGTAPTVIAYTQFDVMGMGGYGVYVQARKWVGWVDVPGTPFTETAVGPGRFVVYSSNLLTPPGSVGVTFCGGAFFAELRQERVLIYRRINILSWYLQDLDRTTATDWALDVGQSYQPTGCTQTITTVSKTSTSAVVDVTDPAIIAPDPIPEPCASSVGVSGDVMVGGSLYRVTITDTQCGASVVWVQ